MNKLNGLVVACMLLAPGLASAAVVNGNITVLAEVGTGCTVTNTGGATANFGTIDFGEIYDFSGVDIVQQIDASGGTAGIEVECTVGTNYSIEVDGGQNYTGTSRALAGAVDEIAYTLHWNHYTDPAIPVSAPEPFVAVAGSFTHTVWGKIAANHASVTPGSYTDVVAVIVSW